MVGGGGAVVLNIGREIELERFHTKRDETGHQKR